MANKMIHVGVVGNETVVKPHVASAKRRVDEVTYMNGSSEELTVTFQDGSSLLAKDGVAVSTFTVAANSKETFEVIGKRGQLSIYSAIIGTAMPDGPIIIIE